MMKSSMTAVLGILMMVSLLPNGESPAFQPKLSALHVQDTCQRWMTLKMQCAAEILDVVARQDVVANASLAKFICVCMLSAICLNSFTKIRNIWDYLATIDIAKQSCPF